MSYKVVSKFDNFVDFTFVDLEHVRCVNKIILNNQAAKCAPYEENESNPKVFMPKFNRLNDQNYTHSYSVSHTNTIEYLQAWIFFNTITQHSTSTGYRSLNFA